MYLTENILQRLYSIIVKELSRQNIENALEAIAAYAEISYEWNQNYSDVRLENTCYDIVDLFKDNIPVYDPKKKIVMYYDSFGFDTRGLTLIYLKAIAELGYSIIYVTRDSQKDKQETLHKVLKDKNVHWEYICFKEKYTNQIKKLLGIIYKYKPEIIFMYSHPYDIAGNIVFSRKINGVTRYKINLTDHAYWFGVCSFDYCIEFRNYGCTISKNYRGIKDNQILKLPYYPYVDNETKLEELPFDDSKRFIFSGGALYKTFGEGNEYYKLVDFILSYDNDIIFLYAGAGDDTRLKQLMNKYPDRVFHVLERKDFFKIIEKSVFYLNTYPVVGAQMTQYCAKAGKVPVTLRHNKASDGFLLNQAQLKIEFDTLAECKEEIKRLLKEEDYLKYRQNLLSKSVISENVFKDSLSKIMIDKVTPFKVDYLNIDTIGISNEYRYRMNEKKILDGVAKKRHSHLFKYFPFMFVKRFVLLHLCK